MISYAQNFEDVMLARAFAGRSDGFYVDIGACFPDAESVTRHFYDLGWSGINVEPMPEPFARLAAQRVRDVNLRMAVADRVGEIAIYEGTSVGESSAVRPGPDARSEVVPCTTLAALCRAHVTRPIDFLKIDVEGLEEAVLEHGDWQTYRPAIVIVEVTAPWSTVRRPEASRITAFLANVDYREVYFDGLNAFFLATEMAHLAAHFSSPPNVLDGFVTAAQASAMAAEREARAEAHARTVDLAAARAHAADAEQRATHWHAAHGEASHRATVAEQRAQHEERRAQAAERRAQVAEGRAWDAEGRARHAEAAFAAIQSSRSWRLTAPLRALGKVVRPPSPATPATQTERAARFVPSVRPVAARALRRVVRAAKRTRTFDRAAPVLRERFPRVWSRLKRFLQAHPASGDDAAALLAASAPAVVLAPDVAHRIEGSATPLFLPRPAVEALAPEDLAALIAHEAARRRGA